MSKTTTCLLAASVMAVPAWAFAAAATPQSTRASQDLQVSQAGQGVLDSAVSAPKALQITAGEDEANAQIKLTFQAPSGLLTVGLKAPLKKGSDSQSLATLDGLSGATSVELQYSGGWITGIRTVGDQEFANVCQRIREAAISQSVQSAMDKLILSAGGPQAKIAEGDLSTARSEATRVAEDRWDKDQNHNSTSCIAGDLAPLTGPEGRRLADEYYSVLYKKGGGGAVLVGVNGEAGSKSLTYYDGATLASHDVSESVWSAGAFVSYTPGNTPVLFIASYKNQRTYEDADSAFLCGPPGGGGIVTCINGPIGPPKKTDKQLLSLEGRAKFGDFGFAVTTTYDFENEVWGVDAPIYLITDAAGGLTGGVRLGWRDDTDDVKASIFVSKPFTLLGN